MPTRMLLAVSSLVLAGVVGAAQPAEIADEDAFDAAMKDIGKTFGAVRQSMEDRSGEDVVSGAEHLAELFVHVEAFWETRGVEAAAGISVEAREAASAIKAAVESQDFQAIAPARDRLRGTCRSCHTEYRERVDEDQYRIKSGVIQ